MCSSVSQKDKVWKLKYLLILNKTFFLYWREILSDDSHRSRGNRGFMVKKVTSWSLFSAAGQTHLWFRGNYHCLSLGQLFVSYRCEFMAYQNKHNCKANNFAKMQLLRRLSIKWWKRIGGEKGCCQISFLFASPTLKTIHKNTFKATNCDLTFRLSLSFLLICFWAVSQL